jgi:hypothetical protein
MERAGEAGAVRIAAAYDDRNKYGPDDDRSVPASRKIRGDG